MTVASALNRKSFAGDDATTSFSTSPVVFFDSTDLEVYIVVDATGVATLKTENTHYTVTGGSGSTGTVNLAGGSSPHGALLSGTTLLILRVMPITQSTDFVQNDPSDAEVAEDALDKLTMILQQLQEQINRALLLPVSTTLSEVAFPDPEAGLFIRGNATEDGFENATVAGLGAIGVPVVIGDGGTGATTAATARTNLDVDQAVNSRTAETDVAENDLVGIRDVSAGTDDKATAQNLFNVIGGMTAHSGTPDIDNDQLAIYDNSQSAPKQRKVPARLVHVPVRQTALAGAVDSSGFASFLTTGSGLRPGIDASPTALCLTAAAGFDDLGEVNYYERLTADVTDPLGADLLTSNTAYIYRTLASAWGSTLVPPDYAYAFNKTRGALLNFEGADASTTMLDDFGNTWTASGNAQIDDAQFKFGASSLLLDGTGDFVQSTDFPTLGEESWEASCWFRLNATSGVHAIFALENATGFGVCISVDHNTGNRRLNLLVSSNGTSNDLVSANGSTTTIALNVWHKVRVVFDALAGTYRAYLSVNGAAETQEITASSTTRVCPTTKWTLGDNSQATPVAFNGWLDAFRFIRGATATAAATPSASAPAITDYPYHWFSIPEMKMYEVTSASGSAGANPGMTAVNRVFVGEADTDATTVTAARTYALRGETYADSAALAANQHGTTSHRLGCVPSNIIWKFINITPQLGYAVGDLVDDVASYSDGTNARYRHVRADSKTIYSNTGGSPSFVLFNKYTATAGTGTLANWGSRFVLERGW